jgi:hypothetical protein
MMAAHVLLVALAVSLQAPKADDSAWQTYTSKEGGFSVDMPGKPTEQKATPQTPQGPLNVIIAFLKAGDVTYIAMRIQNPLDVPVDQEDAFIMGARGSDVASTKGKLIDEKTTTLDGHKVGDFTVESPAPDGSGGSITSRVRYYPRGKWTYNIRVMTPKGKESPEETKKFFDSLKIGGGESKDDK